MSTWGPVTELTGLSEPSPAEVRNAQYRLVGGVSELIIGTDDGMFVLRGTRWVKYKEPEK